MLKGEHEHIPRGDGMSIIAKQRGDWKSLEKFLGKNVQKSYRNRKLDEYGQMGLNALVPATPVRTGKTAASWYYEIDESSGNIVLRWNNRNVSNGNNVAVMIDYGHGTKTGGYVPGRKFIKPAMEPVLKTIEDAVWKEVKSNG